VRLVIVFFRHRVQRDWKKNNLDGFVKTLFFFFFVIPAKAGDSVDFDPVVSNGYGSQPARE